MVPKQIYAIGASNCAIDGETVKCWGEDAAVDGAWPHGSSARPIAKSGLKATRISRDYSNACAIGQDQLVRCWGNNEHAWIGNGASSGPVLTPTVPTGLGAATEVVPVPFGSCAILENSEVWCWGGEGLEQGALEQGGRTPPLSVPKPLGVRAISMHWDLFVTPEHELWEGAAADFPTHKALEKLPAVLQVVGYQVGVRCVLTDTPNHDVYCWGANANGEVGAGPGYVWIPEPQLLTFSEDN